MMLSLSRGKCGHKAVNAIAHTIKRGLSHLLLAKQKGQSGAVGVVAFHVPKANRSTVHVPFVLLPVAMPAGPWPWFRYSLENGSKLGYRQIQKN